MGNDSKVSTTVTRILELSQQEPDRLQELEKFRRTVTVLFTDIQGSTAYYEKFGDLVGFAMVHQCNSLTNPRVKAKHAPSAASESTSGSAEKSAATLANPNGTGGGQQIASANEAQLEELEQQMNQLSSRASSVSNSLDTLRREQNAQGYGLRGDISSSQQLMKTYMAKAQVALQNQDAQNAKKYLDLAQPQVENLEKFLGH
jgi:hypothetical protein